MVKSVKVVAPLNPPEGGKLPSLSGRGWGRGCKHQETTPTPPKEGNRGGTNKKYLYGSTP